MKRSWMVYVQGERARAFASPEAARKAARKLANETGLPVKVQVRTCDVVGIPMVQTIYPCYAEPDDYERRQEESMAEALGFEGVESE